MTIKEAIELFKKHQKGAVVGGGEKELVTEGPKASLMEPA
jgi:hypothetical protein